MKHYIYATTYEEFEQIKKEKEIPDTSLFDGDKVLFFITEITKGKGGISGGLYVMHHNTLTKTDIPIEFKRFTGKILIDAGIVADVIDLKEWLEKPLHEVTQEQMDTVVQLIQG